MGLLQQQPVELEALFLGAAFFFGAAFFLVAAEEAVVFFFFEVTPGILKKLSAPQC